MKEKVNIVIEPDRRYDESHKDGATFTSVNIQARLYGGSSPCDTNEEINKSIKHYTDWIIKNGDIPIIDDRRIKQKTLW